MSFGSVAISASARAGKKSEFDADIIEFVEASWGLKMTLFPVQRVILKAHYGLELDDENTFEISDWTRTKIETHTEKSYLRKIYEDGRCNIGEVIPGKQRREMILSIGRRSGKCVTGETLIPTNRGMVRIDSLGDPNGAEIQPLQVNVAQESGGNSRSAYFYNGGVKPTKYLETFCGYRIEGTGNHRIKVVTPECKIEWKYLEEIEEGDIACINRSSQLWPNEYVDISEHHTNVNQPKYLDEQWGELLGLLAGDGHWTNDKAISITVGEKPFEKYLMSLFRDLFGKVSYFPDKRKVDVGRVSAHGKDIRQFLNNLGWIVDCTTTTKQIPYTIMQSPKSVVCAFLRGLFETDGSAYGTSITLSSASYDLARETQLLLLNIGITSNLSRSNREDRVEYRIRLKGSKSKRLYAQHIGFISERKKKCLEGVMSSVSYRVSNEGVPFFYEYAERLKKFHPNLKHDLKSATKYTPYWKIKKIADHEDLSQTTKSQLYNLIDLDYFFDPVIKVELREAHVFDLNVPNGAMFIGNGFTNHNTTISACIAAYETYKLIKKDNPQKFYGLPQSNNIQIISVATDKDQAGLLYQEVSGHYRNCAFFGPYTANNTLSYARFQTPADVEKYGRYIENQDAKATLKITFRSCVAKGLRGAGNICVILDEVAHFTETGQSGAEEVYNAVVPSTSAYSAKDPNNPTIPIGEVEGRIILISSPLGKQGLFYNLFMIGMGGGRASDNILAVQAPTWEVNPTVPAQEFEKHYLKNAAVFFTEYGGEFTDRTRGWITDEQDLLSCVDPQLRPQRSAPARMPHFMGIDLGLVGDGTALAIGHLDGEEIVVDLVVQIKAGEGIYHDKERLEFDDVADWVLEYTKKFYIQEGMFDQWAGIPFQQALEKRGLKNLNSTNMTKQITSQMYQNFKDMMWDQKIKLYNRPNYETDGHEPYLQELLELQQTVHGKHLITVEAPQTKGKHDDMSDALVRMTWLASNNIGKGRYFASSGSGSRQFRHPLAGGKAFATGGRYTGRGGTDAKRVAPKSPRYNLRDSINGRFGKK
jgi:intein/homing endonuclease